MQEAIGTQLGEIWDEMDICKKKIVVDQVIDIEKKLLSLSFTLYIPLEWSHQCVKPTLTSTIAMEIFI